AVGGPISGAPAAAYARLRALYDRGYWLEEPCSALAIDDNWLLERRARARERLANHGEFGNGIPLEAQRWVAGRARVLPVDAIEAWQDALIDLTMKALSQQLGVGAADMSHLARMVFSCPTAFKAVDACIQFMKDNLYRSVELKTRRPEILRAIEFIRRRYAEELSVAEVAKNVSLSANYFSNLFKRESGMTFTAYLTHHRIERAKGLLRDTDLHAYEIASRCGFSDDAYFSRTFKQVTGMRPITFRQRERESN
ncbi:MAG: helix-turn-helix transcriptional regulator, partial [Clostridiales bacterium]|nr:helix-turn-helix transcriptional regulator [Clostridiales bacterium]